jgi:hypothetical protein
MGLAIANNNPGNLKDPATGSFRRFNTPQEGYAELLNDLEAKKSGTTSTGLGPDSSLIDFASKYAPANDNNATGAYAADLANHMGVRPDTKLKDLDVAKWAAAVAKREDVNSPFGNQEIQSSNTNPNPTAADVHAPKEQFGTGDKTDEVGILPNVGLAGRNLSTNIGNRFQEGSKDFTSTLTGLSHGDLAQAGSGALQTVGDVAGGVGDIAGGLLELVPGIQAAEKGLSGAVKSFTGTSQGKAITGALSKFSQDHPQIAGDVGAVVNIASVIPMFRGLGLVKGGVQDAVLTPLKSKLENAAQVELTGALKTKAAGEAAQATSRGMDPIKYITKDTKLIPAVVENPKGGFMYDSSKGVEHLSSSLSADEEALQNLLTQTTKKEMINVQAAKSQMTKDILRAFPASTKGGKGIRAINEFFDNLEPTLGGRGWIGVEELNNLKREIGSGVNWLNLGAKNGEIRSAMYRSFMTQVEKAATKAGVKGVKELNKTMAQKIVALDALGALNGSKVIESNLGKTVRELARDITGAGAEILGSMGNAPFSSALAGRGLVKFIPGLKAPFLQRSQLLRKGGRGSSASSITKGLIQAGGAETLRQPGQ